MSAMNQLSEKIFSEIIELAKFRARFKRDLQFKASVADFPDLDWNNLELLPVWNRSGNGGILVFQPDDQLYCLPFEIQRHAANGAGQASMICNFCCTWHNSNGAGLMLYYPPDLKDGNTVGTNVCYDLKCSEHVRTKTDTAIRSRVQLPETMTEDARIRRLKLRLNQFIVNSKIQTVTGMS